MTKKADLTIEERPFKVLAVDGGGIRGLYTAAILAKFEEEFGNPISDYFDMICGTSTGAIIALGIASKIPCSDLVSFYKKYGADIFPNTGVRNIYRRLMQLTSGGKYTNTKLKRILEETFGEKAMINADNLLCIPSFNVTTGTTRVFKYPHKEGGYKMDATIKMSDVALASSAAPTYFPLVEIQGHQFIDGGVWANNPVLCGILEAKDHFIGKDITTNSITIRYNNLQILSIGTIKTPNGLRVGSSPNKSFINWGNKLFDCFIDGQEYFANHFATKLLESEPGNIYTRIGNPEGLSINHSFDLGLDNISKKALLTLESFGNRVGYDYLSAKRTSINPFFKELKTYKTK